ncbi:MAG: hypothetical protein ACRD22_01210 [Terriglobia bacterium]
MPASRLEAWHQASGIPYPFPDLCGPGWFPPIEAVYGALGMKLQMECFLWFDPVASHATRSRTLLRLEEQAETALRTLRLDEAVCWLPPTVETSFSKLLERRGWRPSPWRSWSRQL